MKKKEQVRGGEEFNRFKELTRKLVAVPKKEVDEKREAYDQKKEEKPAK